MATPAPIAPSTIDRSPLVNGASVPEPSFAYTDLRGIGKVDIDDLLDYVHDTAREFPGYLRLYEKYLKQRWDVTELDFATDVRDWNERMSEEERETFLKVASGFHHGERQVTVCLGPSLSSYSRFTSSGGSVPASPLVAIQLFHPNAVTLDPSDNSCRY